MSAPLHNLVQIWAKLPNASDASNGLMDARGGLNVLGFQSMMHGGVICNQCFSGNAIRDPCVNDAPDPP